jgi:hypothetical protein
MAITTASDAIDLSPLVIMRAARFGVLKTFTKGMSSGTSSGMMNFAIKPVKAPASRARAVVGFTPVARMACLDVA